MSSISVGRITSFPCPAQLSIGETFIPASAQPLRPHRHPFAQIHLVLEGRYVESSRGRNFNLGPGSALFRPAQELHSNRFVGAAVRGLLVDLEPSITAWLLPGVDVSMPCYFPDNTFDDLRTAFACEAKQDGSERYTVLHALALTLAARISRLSRDRASARPLWIEEALAIIRNRYFEELHLAALASEIGVSASTVAMGFRRFLRQSVGEFLLEVRLQHAREAILESEAPLSGIAVSCGFYDQAHLTRRFRRRYGMTPGMLRRRSRPSVQT